MQMQSSSCPPRPKSPPMARSGLIPSSLADGLVFTAGAFLALLLFLGLYSFFSPTPIPNRLFSFSPSFSSSSSRIDDTYDPPDETFYDDPTLTYTIDKPMSNWDEKRRHWLKLHPSFSGGKERILMVSGSQPYPCRSYHGDHILLRSFKNKADYCRLHGIELFYNTALLNPSMDFFWAKIPVIRAAMLAHPEAEWIWWVDSDAIITDMDFSLPLDRYRGHNMVVNGWPQLIYEKKSWCSLNAGVFLIRNSQWAFDFMDEWASMGPQSPDYEKWGKLQTSTFKDKMFPNSDDQSGLAYLILTGKGGWRDKIYLENEYYFQGYFAEIVGRLDEISEQYVEEEQKGPAVLRRRHAEGVFLSYAKERNTQHGKEKGVDTGPMGWRRPFVTHFTGCQPCSGDRNKVYSADNCTMGMYKALNFADDQVLRIYGFRHASLASADVQPLPFDYPRSEG
ncbi:hypothetical protein LUZ61_008964 [Rhynchospora tenuis]|uniref:Uncharacterized protein n=1 Tax=Rhynchospora tenuis TaxID=198213 RepID=A0AAD5ZWB5_9POAL|nr:hypothetical protein LUZ61_008964 [Rhynchospora tenuis]